MKTLDRLKKKFNTAKDLLPQPKIKINNLKTKIGIINFGSTTRAINESLNQLSDNGIDINRTIIGKGAYIGSGCNLVAPLIINHGSTIGAGSTITQDTPSNLLTLARSKQVVVNNWKRAK